MLTNMKNKLKAERKTIVYTEGCDNRILPAASQVMAEDLMDVILVGPEEDVKAAAAELNVNIDKAKILDPATFEDMPKLVEQMVELRKGKMTPEQCQAALQSGNYFGTMLVKAGYANALLGGATYSTADTVRPALQLVKTKPGYKSVSSSFIMIKDDNIMAMGDCAINIKPSAEELAESAVEAAHTAELFGVDPKVAMLSYSTKGSGAGEDVDRVKEALELIRKNNPELKVDGELQFDAAIDPVVAAKKAPGSDVAGQANVFIFPEIQSANIGYKIAQRLGGYEAIGPIMQGLNAPINDLSRGCNVEEVYKMSIITAALD